MQATGIYIRYIAWPFSFPFLSVIFDCMHLFILCLGVARGSAYFGQGTGSIMLDDLGCTGSEATLTNCSYSSAHNCYHYEDVGVSCSRKIMCVCVFITYFSVYRAGASCWWLKQSRRKG